MGLLRITVALPNHLIRPHQNVRRNRQADLLGGFKIDHQLKLGRLLNRQIGGLGSLENLVNIDCGAFKARGFVG